MLVAPTSGFRDQGIVDRVGEFDVASGRLVAFRMLWVPLRIRRIDIQAHRR